MATLRSVAWPARWEEVEEREADNDGKRYPGVEERDGESAGVEDVGEQVLGGLESIVFRSESFVHQAARDGVEPDEKPRVGGKQKTQGVEPDGGVTLLRVIEVLAEDGCGEGRKAMAIRKKTLAMRK